MGLDRTRLHVGAAPATTARPAPHVAPPAAAAEAALHVRALGPLRIAGEAESGAGWTLGKPRELLLFLLLHPAGATREQVGAALWPEASKAQVSNNFHVTLHRLRRALGGTERVIAAQERYRLDPALAVDFDAPAFEAAGRGALAQPEGAARLAALEAAIARYTGDFLDGEPFGDWTLPHRDRLRRLWQGLLIARAEAEEMAGLPGAVESWERVLAADPYGEDAWRRLMALHARTGGRSRVLALYRRLEALLDAEFGAPPEPATTALLRTLTESAD
jgi:DNA-binding SARP family transcriptional activator